LLCLKLQVTFMPAKRGPINGPKAHIPAPAPVQAEVAAAPSGLKKMTRADFIEFIKIQASHNPIELDERVQEQLQSLQDSLLKDHLKDHQIIQNIEFLKHFATHPRTMAQQLKSRGYGENKAIMTKDGLHQVFLETQTKIQAEAKKNFSRYETTANTNLARLKSSAHSAQDKRTKIRIGLEEMKLKQEKSKLEDLITTTSYLCWMSYFRQVSVASELLLASQEIAYTKESLFSKVPINLHIMAKDLTLSIFKTIVESAYPEENDFTSAYAEISDLMMNTEVSRAARFECKPEGFDFLFHETHLMNKEKFIETLNSLKLWDPDNDFTLDEMTQLCSKLHLNNDLSLVLRNKDSKIKNFLKSKNIENAEMLGFFVKHWYRDSHEAKSIIDASKVAYATELAKVHIKFTKFTTKALCYIAQFQGYIAAVGSSKLKKGFSFVNHDVSVAKFKKLIEGLQSGYELGKKRLQKDWETTAKLARTVENYKDILDDAGLLQKLTDDVETDLGLHEMTCSIFGDFHVSHPHHDKRQEVKKAISALKASSQSEEGATEEADPETEVREEEDVSALAGMVADVDVEDSNAASVH
jgi:hypothetical protein